MRKDEAVVGTRVRSLANFSGVPLGTEGVVDEDYGTGVTIAWNLPDQPLPEGYRAWDGRSAIASGILRDGFDKETELHFLEVVK
jgi:hypothetical protein